MKEWEMVLEKDSFSCGGCREWVGVEISLEVLKKLVFVGGGLLFRVGSVGFYVFWFYFREGFWR